MSDLLPLIILAGSDRRRGSVPRGMHAGDMLRGCKGALPLANGKVLVGELIDRVEQSGRFRQPILIGPARVYQDLELGCEIVDVEGNFADTLDRTVEAIRERYPMHSPVAVCACDILPTAKELAMLLETNYDSVGSCVFWGQLIQAEASEMGAGSWKPSYALRAQGVGMIHLYPGHLVILRPEALRFEVTTRLLHLAFRHRNQPLWRRAIGMNLRGLGMLAWQDLRNLARFQMPRLTFSIPYNCLSAYFRYSRGSLSIAEFEEVFTKTFVHRDFYHSAGNHPVVFVVTRILSLAKDIDTQAELDEAIRDISCVSG